MLYRAIDQAALPLLEVIKAARHIVLTTHVNPDGDAIGSLVAMGRTLTQLGKTTTMVAPTPLPLVAAVLPDTGQVQVYSDTPMLPTDADLIILLDTGNVSRIEPIYRHETAYIQERPLIIIDHHATNSGEGMLNLVITEAASTCEILAQLFDAWQMFPDAETATALLLGSVTDTQSFQTAQTSPQSLRVAANLLERGGRMNEIVRAMLFNKPFEHAKALGLSMAALHHEGPIIWTEFTQAMQQVSGADDEASDEITAYISRIGGAKVYALFKERKDGTVKISLRSMPGIDVGSVAHSFGGGGHREAAGATLHMELAAARRQVLERLHELVG